MRAIQPALAGFVVLAAGGCAAIGVAPQGGTGLARLEQARIEHPNSAPTLRSLGVAYYKAQRLDDARTTFDDATTLDPEDGVAALYLGLTAEAQGDLPAARAAYSTYLRVGRTDRVRSQLASRLAALSRKELEAASREAVANEARIGSVPGSPNTIAVLPFDFTGTDSTLKPLERGFAELLTTDLSRSPRLALVERVRVQSLLDELALQRGRSIDPATRGRAGRLLRAGRIVRGSIVQQGSRLRADALVVDVPTSKLTAQSGGDRELDELLTLETNIALDLLEKLGVTLTTAERDAVERRPTRSIAAFLAYSRGLELSDRGRFDEANRFFGEALRLDPAFEAAKQQARTSESILVGGKVNSASIEINLRGTPEGRAVAAAARGIAAPIFDPAGGIAHVTVSSLNPSAAGNATESASGGRGAGKPTKDPASGTGADNVTARGGKIVTVMQPPHP
jgi:TolB-like protein